MRRTNVKGLALLTLLLLFLLHAPGSAQGLRTVDPRAEQFVDSLIALMTSDEKAGQLNQVHMSAEDATGHINVTPALRAEFRRGGIGSILGLTGPATTRDIQRLAVEESRLGIPIIFGFDVIHGYRTIVPIPLGEAASWDTAAVAGAARIAATEASADGLHWTFAPMVDIARDPRWGRIAEGAGEDPWLGSAMASAAVRGYQGNRLSDPRSIAACAKHFAAYGAAEAGRDYNTVDISERTLREVYLPPFHAAVDAGAATLMSSFNEISGVPASANPLTLTTILRGEWNFRGFVVSDWTAIGELLNHGIAGDSATAGMKALAAGVDMDMVTGIYASKLPALIRDGKVPVTMVDEAVRRILRVKYALGLFDNPYRSCDTTRAAKDFLTPASVALARTLAGESLVLLRNEGAILPFKKNLHTLAVIGPLVESRHDLLGPWAGRGRPEDVVTLLEGIRRAVDSRTRILTSRGCDSTFTDTTGLAGAWSTAREADAVVIVAGEHEGMSGEAASRSDIGLPGVQRALIARVLAAGKPTVLVLLNGRPLALSWEAEHCPAILEAWFPGTEAGAAIADVLFGDVNPSGKLTVTFPRSVGQIPIHYDAKNTGRPTDEHEHYTSGYLDIPSTPLYPFGYGLSYTRFGYAHLTIDHPVIKAGETVRVSVDVTNTGQRTGTEVVQLYLRDVAASVTRPVKQLRGFRRVTLTPGQTVTLTFAVGPEAISYPGNDWKPVIEPGRFMLFVGTSSAETAQTEFHVE
jgi:beta-glucosidase